MPEFALFSTNIGDCAIVWNPRGIVSLQLPERSADGTRALVRARFVEAEESRPPAEVRLAIAEVQAYLNGEPSKLDDIVLDMSGVSPFYREVYELTRQIPRGATTSYGDIAVRLGRPRGARAVGQALGRNPWALIVPCHRVVSSSGMLTGFSAFGGVTTKRKLLALEGAPLHQGSSGTRERRLERLG